MFRRRRAVVLLSLFVTTLGAGSVGYWYYSSSQDAPLDKTPITAQSTPTVSNEASTDLTASPLHAIRIAEQHTAVAHEHDNAAQTTGTDDHPVQVIRDAAEDHEVAVMALSTTLPTDGHSQPDGFADHTSGGWGGMSFAAQGGAGAPRSKQDRQHDSEQTHPTNTTHPHDNTPTQEQSPPQQEQSPPPADQQDNSDSRPQVSVPEPGSLGLLTLGLLTAAFLRRKVVRVR